MTRDEWLRLPVEVRGNWMSHVSLAAFDRYLAAQRRLWHRYNRNGFVIIDVGGKPATYKILEDAAWMKYVVNA